MNPIAIIIAVIVFLILIYIIYTKTKGQVSSKEEQPKVERVVEQPKVERVVEQPKVEQPKVEQPKVEQPTTLVLTEPTKLQQQCGENDISNYDIDETPIKGPESLQRIAFNISNFIHRIRENFALSQETVPNKTSLVGTRLYNKATLKSGIKSEINPPLNKGASCTAYPTEIYIPTAAPSPATSCVGSSCTIDGQLCLPGSVGAGPNLYRCLNKVWVQQSSQNDPFSIDRGLVGLYEVDSFDGVSWKDKSGLGNHATVVSTVTKVTLPIGNGSSKSFVTLSGGPGTGIIFPTKILPPTYTLFTVARYSGTRNGRIFDGIGNNWLSGFWNGQTKVAYHTDPWITNPWNGFTSNWILTSDTNDGYWGNGEYLVTNTNSGKSSTRLSINRGDNNTNESSDWQVAYVAVFNRKLTNAERLFVEAKLSSQFGLTLTRCPAEQTRDEGGVCRWNACTVTGQTRDSNGVCYPPCTVTEQTRVNGVCQCPGGQILVDGVCVCPQGFILDSDGTCQFNFSSWNWGAAGW